MCFYYLIFEATRPCRLVSLVPVWGWGDRLAKPNGSVETGAAYDPTRRESRGVLVVEAFGETSF